MAAPAKDSKAANKSAAKAVDTAPVVHEAVLDAGAAAPAGALADAPAGAPDDAPVKAPVGPIVDMYPALAAPALAAEAPLEVEMSRAGQTTLVRNNASVALMQALGWQLV